MRFPCTPKFNDSDSRTVPLGALLDGVEDCEQGWDECPIFLLQQSSDRFTSMTTVFQQTDLMVTASDLSDSGVSSQDRAVDLIFLQV